jgi:hypothetical protein
MNFLGVSIDKRLEKIYSLNPHDMLPVKFNDPVICSILIGCSASPSNETSIVLHVLVKKGKQISSGHSFHAWMEVWALELWWH